MANLVDLEGTFDIDDVLGEIGIAEAVDHFGIADVLDAIGRQEAMDHFGLVEPEEETGEVPATT